MISLDEYNGVPSGSISHPCIECFPRRDIYAINFVEVNDNKNMDTHGSALMVEGKRTNVIRTLLWGRLLEFKHELESHIRIK